MSNYIKPIGYELTERILDGENDDDVIMDLLTQYFRGFPVEELRKLLQSPDENIVKAGVWIASELGIQASPLLKDIAPLLKHKSKYIRFFALDIILLCASSEIPHAISGAIATIRDDDEAVRWKALRFLANIEEGSIVAALNMLEDNDIRDALKWMIFVINNKDYHDSIIESINGRNKIYQMIAVVAATRINRKDIIRMASNARNKDVSNFAKFILTMQQSNDPDHTA